MLLTSCEHKLCEHKLSKLAHNHSAWCVRLDFLSDKTGQKGAYPQRHNLLSLVVVAADVVLYLHVLEGLVVELHMGMGT